MVHTVVHIGDDAEVSTAAAQRPKKVLVIVSVSNNDASIGEYNLCRNEIVERKPKTTNQRSIAAAQR